MNAEIEKVTEIQDILKFEILMPPGLVVDGKVKTAGRVPSTDEIKQLLLAGKESPAGAEDGSANTMSRKEENR